MINVTKSFLPAQEEYNKYLTKIWETSWLTNSGQFVRELEEKLRAYFGVKHLFFVSNGTIALQIAIKALDLKGEIITTPFSYVATSSSIIWEGCRPVFVDIDKNTLNIDHNKIEDAITDKTAAIIATHVFGNPCRTEEIEAIAIKHGLKIIYDSAHAFGVKYKNKKILNFGDISAISFHATKLFHTVEGGALATNDDALAAKIFYLRNFGHASGDRPEEFIGVGINGKNSEFHAAMGLCILPRVEEIIEERRKISLLYDKCLASANIRKPDITAGTEYNYAYYPIIFSSAVQLLQVMTALNDAAIWPRRYFYPSLNSIGYIKKINLQTMPVSEDIAQRIICLPLYYGLKPEEIELISEIIIKNS